MSGSLSYQLYELVASLTKGEKRHFQLYARRNAPNRESKFLKLFQLLDRMNAFDEAEVEAFLKKDVRNRSKLKSHLYEAIMTSLQLLNSDELSIRIREYICRAELLYHKGLYGQASIQLSKAKKMATSNQQLIHVLEVLKLEKRIEAKIIKSTHYQKAAHLAANSQKIQAQVETETFWSDFSLQLYNHYLKVGHIRNEQELISIQHFYTERIRRRSGAVATFEGELCRIQCHVWYAYIVLDFRQYFKYSRLWMHHYKDKPKWRPEDYDSYLMGCHNNLVALFYLRDAGRFEKARNQLVNFILEHDACFSANTKLNASFYTLISKLNLYIVKGEYLTGYNELEKIEIQLEEVIGRLDTHRKLALYYKMGNICFGASKFKEAIHYFNLIDQSQTKYIRNDLHCFSRTLSLIAHFELENDFLVEYQVKSVHRYLTKMDNMDTAQEEVLRFLRRAIGCHRSELQPNFMELHRRLVQLSRDRYARRPLLYMDLLPWSLSNTCKSKIEDIVKKGLVKSV